MKTVPEKFTDWLNDEMKKRQLSITSLARRAGVSHPTISEIVTYQKLPSYETCLALANVLDKPQTWVLRLAGLLNPESDDGLDMTDWKFILSNITEKDRLELYELAHLKMKNKSKSEKQLYDELDQMPLEERERIIHKWQDDLKKYGFKRTK